MANVVHSVSDLGEFAGRESARHIETTLRGLIRGEGVVEAEGYFQVVTGEPHPLGNFILVSDADDLGSTREGTRELMESAIPSAVLFSAEPSAEVVRFLEESGYAGHGSMPAMAVDLDRMVETELMDGYVFERVVSSEGLQAWTSALAEGYGLPMPVAQLFCLDTAEFKDDDRFQLFAVKKGEEMVATSMVSMMDGLAGVYAVSTLAAERGRGLGGHVTASALRASQKFGYRVGVLQSSEDGYPVYQRLGFGDYGGVPMFVRMPE